MCLQDLRTAMLMSIMHLAMPASTVVSTLFPVLWPSPMSPTPARTCEHGHLPWCHHSQAHHADEGVRATLGNKQPLRKAKMSSSTAAQAATPVAQQQTHDVSLV